MFKFIKTSLLVCLITISNYANAGPALIFDMQTGEVLDEKMADQSWHPASLTKMMTAYVTFKAIKQGKITLNTLLYSLLMQLLNHHLN